MTEQLDALQTLVEQLEHLENHPSIEQFQGVLANIQTLAARFKSFARIQEAADNARSTRKQIGLLLQVAEHEFYERTKLEARDIFTTEQAATYLDLTISTVKYHYTYSKFLTGELMGRSRIFRKAELDAFIEADYKRGRKDIPTPNGARPKPIYKNRPEADDPMNQPEEFDKLKPAEKKSLLKWIEQHVGKYELGKWSSYGLKQKFEQAPEGFQITNGAFRGAMLAAGYVKSDKSKADWKFKKP